MKKISFVFSIIGLILSSTAKAVDHESYQTNLLELSSAILQKQEVNSSVDVSADLYRRLSKSYLLYAADDKPLKQALCYYQKYKFAKYNTPEDRTKTDGINFSNSHFIVLADFTKSSDQLRFFILDLYNQQVFATVTTHGSGRSLKERQANKVKATIFSNENESYLSSHGFFITGSIDAMKSPEWPYGVRLYGLQPGLNDHSYARQILIHPWFRVHGPLLYSAFDQNAVLEKIPLQPNSMGCLAVPAEFAAHITSLIQMENSSGSLVYVYSDSEKNKSDFLDCDFLK